MHLGNFLTEIPMAPVTAQQQHPSKMEVVLACKAHLQQDYSNSPQGVPVCDEVEDDTEASPPPYGSKATDIVGNGACAKALRAR